MRFRPSTAKDNSQGSDTYEAISDLWQMALSAVFHGAGCACAGEALALTPGGLETDILDFLEYRYPRASHPELANTIAVRRSHATPSFPQWVAELDTSLPANDRDAVIASIWTTLESLAEARRFACN